MIKFLSLVHLLGHNGIFAKFQLAQDGRKQDTKIKSLQFRVQTTKLIRKSVTLVTIRICVWCGALWYIYVLSITLLGGLP